MIQFKITCPKCKEKVNIKANESDLGTRYKTSCPNCVSKLMIKLPQPTQIAKPQEDVKKTSIENSQEEHNFYLISSENIHAQVQKFALDKPQLTFGRLGNTGFADLAFITKDMRISRNHCIFRKYKNGITIEDISKGGTLLNEKKLEPKNEIFLKKGDVLRMGQTFFKFMAEKT